MNILRNILTAVWCAIIAGVYGWLTLRLMQDTDNVIAIGAYALPALFALAALIYVPLLVISTIGQLALIALMFFFVPDIVGTSFFGTFSTITIVVAVISVGFVYWDIRYRRHQASLHADPAGEF